MNEKYPCNIFKKDEYIPLGTNSRKIYECFVAKFGWKKQYVKNFAKHWHSNFADNATKEGYAVWFLPYSNESKTKMNQNKTLHNQIRKNGKEIIIICNTPRNKRREQSHNIRVTFVKQRKNQYIFFGLFKTKYKKIKNNKWILTQIKNGDIYKPK